MDGYLVVLRHTMDDLPIKLIEDRKAAIKFAKSVKQMPTKRIRDVIGTDCSTPHSVCLYRFEDGDLTRVECIVDFN